MRLEQAAGTLGASRAWVFFTVTLPLILPGIIAGLILCFAKAIGEFGATITFVSNIPGETQTLPSAIYTFTQVPGGDAGALRLTARIDRHLDCRPARLRAAGAPRPSAPGARMTLAVDIEHRLGSFRLDVALRGRRRAHRAVRPLGLRQDLADQRHRRADPTRQGSRRGGRHHGGRHRARHLRAGPQAALRLRVPGRAAVPAPDRAAEPALRPLVRARGRSAAASSTGSPTCSASRRCSTAGRRGFPAARSSASPSAARCSPARACC